MIGNGGPDMRVYKSVMSGYAVLGSSLRWKPRVSISLYTVLKDGFPPAENELYRPARSRCNSPASCAMPFERAMYPMVSNRKSGSFSSNAPARKASTSSLVSMISAGSHLVTVIFSMLLFLLIFVCLQGQFGELFGPRNIGLLGDFIAAAEQDDDFFSHVFVIEAVAGAVVNTHFGDSFTGGFYIAGISLGKLAYPLVYAEPRLAVPQFLYPFDKYAGSPDFLHVPSVDYIQQSGKGARI